MKNRLFSRRSLRQTLMAMMLITSSIALALASLGFVINDWVSLRQSVYDQLHAQAGLAGSNVIAALVFDDREAAAQTLNNFDNEQEIIAAIVFQPSGEVFAEYQRDGETVPRILPNTSAGYQGENVFVVKPVTLKDEVIGNILLVSDQSYRRNRQERHLITAIGLFLLSLLVSYFISRGLQEFVTQPIVKLANTARRITEGQDYSLRAKKYSQDEIGELVEDFNNMLHQIQLRDRELNHAREMLEEKVEERTSELTELTKLLEHQANHDTLTGLANRTTFDNRLRMAISHSHRYGGDVAVLFLDLDRFKIINDTLGHIIGDKLLVQVASRFSTTLRESDTLARLGGDEFAVLISTADSETAAVEVAHKLLMEINRPFHIDGYNLHISTSIGISLYPEDGQDAESILKNADTAMYQSKEKGRNQFTFFATEMNTRALRRLELETKLRNAIRNQSFEVHYQPRRDTQTLRLRGIEALVRWYDPEEGEIYPSEFIPLAEECGLVSQIDDWVLEKACTDILSCFEGKNSPLLLSINFSTSQFIRKDLDTVIQDILQRTGFPATKLELEITENLFGPEANNAQFLLEKIRDLGVEISIDDFGKAYSSLSRLKQLPLQTLKIDRSFIMDLGNDPDDEAIVITIITMAHNLGLKVVAEGIETQAQFEFVKVHNCDAVQGFLFGRPMPIEELRREWIWQDITEPAES